MNKVINQTGLEIAIIGMAGRFPGASNVGEFWENLKNGVESITFFSDRELEEAGIDSRILKNPNYVKAGGILKDIDRFDALFFGYTPLEVSVMDPQMRIFHECAWEALEDAGYDPDTYKGLIGFYAGATPHFNWEALTALSEKSLELGEFAVDVLSQKDFLSTRISYKFNLKGPSFSLYTACSTSLTSVHVACQAILNGECSMALAGGITAIRTSKRGYLYSEGMIHSPDGHCRAFDINARGIVGGDGAGIVVLKRLQTADDDGDHIYAIIKGSAINNDGIRKVGFTAPSVQGQAEVIRIAQMMAEVEPETITYVETHGTGTQLGDPVEIEALKLAFNTDKKRFCAIGSVKTNVGHLDSAAGVAGLIKAVLALKYKLIPPSLHFERPNPKLGLEDSPFYVNTTLQQWEGRGQLLRAAVSSFGIGGTNAHAILEEAPGTPQSISPSPSREYKMIMLSAKTKPALDRGAASFARYLQENPGISLADAAYTLQVGRKAFSHRKVLVCSHPDEAVEAFTTAGSGNVYSAVCREGNHPIIYMFPGQGAQYVNMGLDLYRSEPVFRAEMDRCFEIVKPLLSSDCKETIYPSAKSGSPNLSDRINQTEIAQPLIFMIEYALARLLSHWGITPYAMVGHSIGEYTAACLAGVFSLPDALKIVVSRGKLMQKIPGGAMLSVPLPEEELKPLLMPNKNLSLAAVNSPSRCVVSGNTEAIAALAEKLKAQGHEGTLLHTSHAFHSAMMDPILAEFGEEVKKIKLHKPKIPYISNISGSWIANDEAVDPAYWVRHLRCTVRFADALSQLQKIEDSVLMEVGPGKTLSTFARGDAYKIPAYRVLNLVRPPLEELSDSRYLLTKIAQLWLYGGEINWSSFYSGEKRFRISLPTYSFEAQRYPIAGDPYQILRSMIAGSSFQLEQQTPDIADWFYTLSWQPSPLPAPSENEKIPEPLTWIIFIDEAGIGQRLVEMLEQNHQKVISVKAGSAFNSENIKKYVINPKNEEDYNLLFQELNESSCVPQRIVHCWTVDRTDGEPDIETMDQAMDMGLYSLLGIAKALGLQRMIHPIYMQVISSNIQYVTGKEKLELHKTTLLGAIKVIPLEYKNVTCSSIDILLPGQGKAEEEALFRLLWTELTAGPTDKIVAYRGNLRQVQQVSPIRLDQSGEIVQRFKKKGVYLIIGGFGGMGFSIAKYLGKNFQARLILVGRSMFPSRDKWDHWLETHDVDDEKSRKIKIIKEMEAGGAEVMNFNADVADYLQMKVIFKQSIERFGPFNGILHTAGIIDYGGAIQSRSREITRNYMASKVIGTLVLEKLLHEHLNEKQAKLDFLGLFSSLGNILYMTKFGQVSYNAANEFLDAYVHKFEKDETFAVTINWCDWSEIGMTVNAIKHDYVGKEDKIDYKSMIPYGVNPDEGVEAFIRIMEHSQRRVLVYSYDLLKAVREQERYLNKGGIPAFSVEEPRSGVSLNQRPQLNTEYVAPNTDIERSLVKIWEKFLGIEKIGVNDDFFELGGDSLKALAVAHPINKELKTNITLTDILLFPTIRALAKNVHEESIFRKLECVVKMNKGQNKKNIFIIHPMHGMVYQYKELAKELADTFNVFGIQARSLVRKSKFPETMQIMVHDYIHQIRQIQEEGPYIIGGYCFGDPVGYCIVKQLEDMGFPVELLIMFDEPAFIPGYVLWVYRQKYFGQKLITALMKIWPPNRKKKREHRIWAEYREFVENQKKQTGEEIESINQDEVTEIKKAILEKKIDQMYKIYIRQWAFKRTTGIIHTPILDIKAKDTHFKVKRRPLKKMTCSKLLFEETGGDHLTMFTYPHVKTTAEIIKKHVSK